jgi:hypothetical protein
MEWATPTFFIDLIDIRPCLHQELTPPLITSLHSMKQGEEELWVREGQDLTWEELQQDLQAVSGDFLDGQMERRGAGVVWTGHVTCYKDMIMI